MVSGLLDPAGWGLPVLLGVLGASALGILVFGTLLTRQADQLADRTGWGEAIFGAVLLGASTSLAGVVTSVSTAWQGLPELAASNAVGGIAVQTAFLAVADMSYRRANLEHAAASLENMLLGALLCGLLAFPLVAMASPAMTVLGVHPASLVLFGAYAFGIRVVHQARRAPLWQARWTGETREDLPSERSDVRTSVMWLRFTALALACAATGLLVAQAGVGLVRQAGLGENLVGAYITGIVTSLPELVVTLAAVRAGALTLAVGGIIGGNAFDILFLAFADIAYRDGSIYHAMGSGPVLLLALTIVMTAVLLLGLLRRQRVGVGGIGFEGVAILALYGLSLVLLAIGAH